MPEIFSVKLGSLKEKSMMLWKGNPLHTSLIRQNAVNFHITMDQTCKIGFDPRFIGTSSRRNSIPDNQRLFNLEWPWRSLFEFAPILHYIPCLSYVDYSKSPWNYPVIASVIRTGKESSSWLVSSLTWAFKIYSSKWNQA